MSKSGTDSQVAANVVDSVGGSVPGKTLLGKSGLVERPIGVEDGVLVVLRTVLVEEILRKEGELSGVPGVGGVHSTEDHDAESDTERRREESQL